ncbi:hypothetical protein OFO10_05630 [Campylobacter sp. VBCF_06 NA8]|uniref:hypothetical protein n=1 Tax=Campylobacter sp. VBCF_06 NA8 TaxID=2983822 RepID=UPI0022E9CA0C|nr:hypothetical protein [Campylobacter sp. VBCF_06 NA8]MDA3046634.1 hypothetical protein [Campylobacter sp. VBCF_06 NA8]
MQEKNELLPIPTKTEILVLDDMTKEKYSISPKRSEPLTKGYEMILAEDERFRDYFVKKENKVICPIQNLNENLYLVHSGIRNNLYFPLKDFQILYRDELRTILSDISKRMGIKRYEFEYFEQEINLEKFRKDLNIGAGGEYKAIKASAKFSKEVSRSKEAKAYEGKFIKGEFPNSVAVSKEELQKFIDKEQINLSALPPEFASEVKYYLDYGVINAKGGSLEQTEEMATSLQKCANSLVNMSLNVGVAGFLRAGVEANFINESETSYSFYSKIRWKLEF